MTIHPFQVNVSKDVLQDLQDRLLKTRYKPDFAGEQVNFQYGMQVIKKPWVSLFSS